MQEPDWSSLANIQFLLYNRISDLLNAALSSIALSGMPEAQEQPPEFWRDRATHKIYDVLNLYTAWTALARFKMGEASDRGMRPFPVNLLLNWLGTQLQLSPVPADPSNLILYGSQETLQEALWLLYSVGYTQGSGVRLELESSRLGVWFRVRFNRTTPLPTSIDDLLTSFGTHWRAQDTAFELAAARDFIRLNGSELILASGDGYGDLSFFVRAAASGKTRPLNPEMLSKAEASSAVQQALASDATPAFPEAKIVPPSQPEIPPILRPLPPPHSSRPRPAEKRKSGEAPAVKIEPAAEGSAPPVEPQEPALSSEPGEATVIRLISEDTPTVRDMPVLPAPEPPAEGTVIVAVKIPAPQLPSRLAAPPAATTVGAIIRQTQTLSPVKSDSAAAASAEPAADPTPTPPDDPAAPEASPKEGV